MVLGNTLSILRPPDHSTPPIQTGWNAALVRNMHMVLGDLAQQITSQVFGGLPEGTSRPASVKANVFWLDITSATAPVVKLFDGTDDITVMTFDYAANTVDFAGATFDLVDDTTPQLGGDLDLNGNVITGLEIGTDVQAQDATLTSLAAVAGIAGDILFASGTDTWARLAKGTDNKVLTLISGLPTWITPDGGATIVSKTADQTVNNSTTFIDDDHLLFAMEADKSYIVNATLLISATDATPDIKFQWIVPASCTMFWNDISRWGRVVEFKLAENSTLVKTLGSGTLGIILTAIVRNDSTAGNLQLQWAQNIAHASNVKLLKHSHLTISNVGAT